MHADFPQPHEYTRTNWRQPTSGARSLDWYKTPTSPRPHPFLEAELLTGAGNLCMKSGGKAPGNYRSIMPVLSQYRRGRRPCYTHSHDRTAYYKGTMSQTASWLDRPWQGIKAPSNAWSLATSSHWFNTSGA